MIPLTSTPIMKLCSITLHFSVSGFVKVKSFIDFMCSEVVLNTDNLLVKMNDLLVEFEE